MVTSPAKLIQIGDLRLNVGIYDTQPSVCWGSIIIIARIWRGRRQRAFLFQQQLNGISPATSWENQPLKAFKCDCWRWQKFSHLARGLASGTAWFYMVNIDTKDPKGVDGSISDDLRWSQPPISGSGSLPPKPWTFCQHLRTSAKKYRNITSVAKKLGILKMKQWFYQSKTLMFFFFFPEAWFVLV